MWQLNCLEQLFVLADIPCWEATSLNPSPKTVPGGARRHTILLYFKSKYAHYVHYILSSVFTPKVSMNMTL